MYRWFFSFFLFLNGALYGQTIQWETVVYDSTTWNYRVPDASTPASWYQANFDASSWANGIGGFGFGDNDDNTVIPTNSASVYIRKNFQILDVSSIQAFVLNMDYDDGFVAYLNGVEIARNGIAPGIPNFNSLASISHEAKLYQNQQPDQFVFNALQVQTLLHSGNNILAVEVHNQTTNSADFSCRPFLSVATFNSTPSNYPTPSWFVAPAVFTSSNLPIVVLNTNGITIPDEPKIDGFMGIIYNGPGQLNALSNPFNEFYGQIAIERRGSSSGGFPQQSYGLETRGPDSVNYDVSLFDWPADNDWVLYAPYTDKAMMRNVLTYHLGNEMGRWAPRTQFCEVILNGTYIGVYVLIEKIKTNPGRVAIDPLTYTDTLNNQLTGGYIVKIDKTTAGGVIAWTSPYTCQAPGTGPITYQLHDPSIDLIHPLQKAYIQDYITDWENALKSPNFQDPQLGFRPYMDIASFIDYFLISELSKNVDGYRISTFLHKKRFSEGGKLVAGPLWDYNIAWGNANYCQGGSTTGWEMNFNSVCGGSGGLQNPFWWNRLLQDSLYANEVNCRWFELRQSTFSDTVLNHYIDSMALYLNEAAVRHYQKWPILGTYVWPNNYIGATYQDEVNYLKTWIHDRMIWMDANMFGTCTAGLQSQQIDPIRVFPNPADALLFIEGVPIGQDIQVIDTYGRTVKRVSVNQETTSLDISGLSPGIYSIQLENNPAYARFIKR